MSVHLCQSCARLNRLPAEHAGKQPLCGSCKAKLDTSGSPRAIDSAALKRLIDKAPIPVLADFWAPWCGPCKTMTPVLDQVARAHAGELIVVKINSDDNPEASALHKIQSIPALLLFKNGREADRQVGAVPKPALESWLRRH